MHNNGVTQITKMKTNENTGKYTVNIPVDSQAIDIASGLHTQNKPVDDNGDKTTHSRDARLENTEVSNKKDDTRYPALKITSMKRKKLDNHVFLMMVKIPNNGFEKNKRFRYSPMYRNR